jgi:hypothetical protein
MGVYDDVKRVLRSLIVIEDRFDRLAQSLVKHDAALTDHEKRLIRIETMIELARERRRLEG